MGFRAQVKYLLGSGDLWRDEVHLEVPQLWLEHLVGSSSSERRTDSSERVGKRKRSYEVIVHSCIEPEYSVLYGILGREDQYGDLKVTPS